MKNIKKIKEINNNKLPAGKYIISDLCYIIPDKSWDLLLEETGYLQDTSFLIDNKIKGCSHITEYGDGCYEFENNFNKIIEDKTYNGCLPVDSGTIGILSYDFVKEYGIELNDGYVIVEFEEDFNFSYEEGTLYIDSIEIKTGEEEEDY